MVALAMIIKGIFRRYERWNPVHPTSGTFWGMGLGVGCGVGWGPGFGPEVIGYVGAGCGVGFNVGLTLAGFGLGLPANYLFRVPFSAVATTGRAALTFAQFNWNNVVPQISVLQRETSRRLSGFDECDFFGKGVDLFGMSNKMCSQTRSFSKSLGVFCSHFSNPRKGSTTGHGET